MPRSSPFSESEARAAIEQAVCWSDALRALGYEPKGANIRTIKRWTHVWGVPTDHFDAHIGRRRAGANRMTPLEAVMVENSTYDRGKLKKRLLAAGIKQPVCELCGQGETWRGKRMSLVLDHINGESNDHRLENLRIVCPNCNATLDTHCGRNTPRERHCAGCGISFAPRDIRHRYCSPACVGAQNGDRLRGVPAPARRKVERPPYERLKAELAATNFCAVGRTYGVSDKAVRKWLIFYERQRERDQQEEGGG